jgi:hypothetical protein
VSIVVFVFPVVHGEEMFRLDHKDAARFSGAGEINSVSMMLLNRHRADFSRLTTHVEP